MATYPNKPVKTVTINYTDPAPGAVPQLQILNDVAGNVGEIQFKGKSGNFAATSNLVWDGNAQSLNIRGNVRMTGTIVGNLIGNPSSLRLIGGGAGDVLTTDGTGNVSWQPITEVVYGNSEVANYLPTFTGNLKAGNANLGNTVTANYIIGNLYGTANSAITSNIANIALTVAGENVTGIVSNSNFANTANTADVANSVQVANIVGIGNIATLNTDGNSSNVLYGNGVFAAIVGGYSNSDVANYLPTYTGALNTANITFVANGVIDSIANSSGDGGGYTTMTIKPDVSLSSDQYLIVDPTGPNHIHIRAGGTQDASSTDFYLGGEKNFVRISDSSKSVRMQNESLQYNGGYSFDTTFGFSSAAWQDDGYGGYQVIINDPTPDVFTAIWGLQTTSSIEIYDGSSYYTLIANGNSNTPSGGPITFGVTQAPPSSPTNIVNLSITNYVVRTNYAEVNGTDFTVNVYDDVRITGSDIVSIRNRSSTDPVQIVTDYDGSAYTWTFNSDATMTFPDSTVQNTAWTGTIDASNVTGLGNISTINLDGNASNILYGDGSFAGAPVTYADSNVSTFLASYGTNTITTTGNISVGNIIGNGQALTGLNGANVSGEVSYAATANSVAVANVTGIGNIATINKDGNASNILYGNGVFASAPITYGNSNVSTFLASYGSNTITTTGNITAGKFIGDGSSLSNVTVNVAGNIVGTSPNVSLVAGSFTATFDNTGILTLPTCGGDEGGEINLGIPASNTSLITAVKFDVYQNKIRFFDGSTKGAYIDLSQTDTGVGTLLNNRVSGYVNAGTYVTMDNLKATVSTSGSRGLSITTASGSYSAFVSGSYVGYVGGVAGQGTSITVSTTPSASLFGWNFTSQGDTATYIINDTTNSRCYRVTMMIGGSYNNNMISIERLI